MHLKNHKWGALAALATCLALSMVIGTPEENHLCGEGTEIDCLGVCRGKAIVDDCGICNGKNLDQDDCGRCFGTNQDKGCDGVCYSEKKIDDCGQCDGLNVAKGCDGICHSGKTTDSCGDCGGNNTALGCDGICNSGKIDTGCGCGIDCTSCAWVTSWNDFTGPANEFENDTLRDFISGLHYYEPRALPSCIRNKFEGRCAVNAIAYDGIQQIYGECGITTQQIQSSFPGVPSQESRKDFR